MATVSASPLIVAHRGASAEAPENTLQAFRLAWQQGADAIEGDFHLTRDRQIVCIHDPTTAKLGGKPLMIRKTRLAELQSLDAGSWKGAKWADARIPTLEQILATLPPDKKLYIEIKSSPKILRHLYKTIDAASISPHQLVIIAFSPRIVQRLKRQRPTLKAILLVRHRNPSPKTKNLEPDTQNLISTLRRIHADGLSVYAHPHLDQTFANSIRSAGYELHVWTVDSPEDAQRWTTLGVTSITTNRPALILETLSP